MNLRPAQIQYAWFERWTMRALLAWAVERGVRGSVVGHEITVPNGLARLVDLHFLLDPAVFQVCRYLLWVALALYVFRCAWSIVLPYITLVCVAAGSIVNSEGAISHYLQILALVLCAQTAAHFYSWWKQRRGEEKRDRVLAESRIIFWSQQAVVATYFVSAQTKLLHTSGRWFLQSPLIAVQIIKTTEQDYYDRLEAAALNSGTAVAEWIVQHPLLVGLTLSCGLLLELSSPLALLGRRWALFYGLSLLAFHESVERVMRLSFPYHEYLVFIFLVNVPFWIVLAGRSLALARASK